jgi:hypothetical protein
MSWHGVPSASGARPVEGNCQPRCPECHFCDRETNGISLGADDDIDLLLSLETIIL